MFLLFKIWPLRVKGGVLLNSVYELVNHLLLVSLLEGSISILVLHEPSIYVILALSAQLAVPHHLLEVLHKVLVLQ